MINYESFELVHCFNFAGLQFSFSAAAAAAVISHESKGSEQFFVVLSLVIRGKSANCQLGLPKHPNLNLSGEAMFLL